MKHIESMPEIFRMSDTIDRVGVWMQIAWPIIDQLEKSVSDTLHSLARDLWRLS